MFVVLNLIKTIAYNQPNAKITIIDEHTKGYYSNHVDVLVEIPDLASYKVSCMSKPQFALEKFLLELNIDADKKKLLCGLIEDYGQDEWCRGADDERMSQSY